MRTAFFNSCISLGWFCGTASSMSLHGLRCGSGPFDWYYSDLKAVLEVIDNDFLDFMLRENLKLVDNNPKEFFDTKYGFYCNHDVKEDFEQEYPFIFKKYSKRAKRFLEDTKRPTCFLRTVRSNQEILYIKENKEYIERVIKKNNCKNEIIFLVPRYMDDLPGDFLWFKLDINQYIGQGFEMRTLFNSSKDFLVYCKERILSEEKIRENISYDITFRTKGILIDYWMNNMDDCIKLGLVDYFNSIDSGVYIWGAGAKGVILLNYLLAKGIQVNGIIDNDDKKVGDVVNGIHVTKFSQLHQNNINIIIAIVSEQAIQSILKQIDESEKNIKVISYRNIYGLLPKLSWDYYR
ncbi:MAG: hypothetical protein IJA34_05355 [Lachnospiraceae bacterium]|nr:hypothetical protein [Lachnospiraceae bacterium]